MTHQCDNIQRRYFTEVTGDKILDAAVTILFLFTTFANIIIDNFSSLQCELIRQSIYKHFEGNPFNYFKINRD